MVSLEKPPLTFAQLFAAELDRQRRNPPIVATVSLRKVK